MNERRRSIVKKVLEARQPDITLILEDVEDPHNVAAILRSADSVGITEIFVVDTQGKMPAKPFGYRSSSGSIKWVTMHFFEELAQCLQKVRQKYPLILATHLSPRSLPLYQTNLAQPVAIAFGNEYRGCSAELLAASNGTLHIPQVGMAKSLNVSVACAVVLYEAYRQKLLAGHYNNPRLHPEEINRYKALWGDYEAIKQENIKNSDA
ncbi:MAG: RNA methyltransferase [Chitinophagaceae bacterium]|jgi:tRNA (guanosine-2'-O-)-methyltransferase|nr:RNA methyltransferase [Chitinophagaceae bacterium]